jgi:hypothetical protein
LSFPNILITSYFRQNRLGEQKKGALSTATHLGIAIAVGLVQLLDQGRNCRYVHPVVFPPRIGTDRMEMTVVSDIDTPFRD